MPNCSTEGSRSRSVPQESPKSKIPNWYTYASYQNVVNSLLGVIAIAINAFEA
ncbi:hypothetical protein [Nostoc sp. CCY 9925]|uniref:hypothetical protein n=1 Tax=Nostoc sp. CCY 9925 TaxID=3103865 RepID=UPI0039C66065